MPGTAAPTSAAVDTTPTSAPSDEVATPALPPPLGDDGPLPALPLTVAVLAVVGVLSAHLWRYTETASWARRTPQR